MKPTALPLHRIFYSSSPHLRLNRHRQLTSSHFNRNRVSAMSITTTATDNAVVVIMGATGAGKSRLSIGMATRFPPSEIINSDKIQLYKGLDITTNKITPSEQADIPHHLLGTFDSSVTGDISPSQFRETTAELISQISARNSLPILVGGSNSFVHALLTDKFDPKHDLFSSSDSDSYAPLPALSSLRYRCCFLWVDVSLPILYKYLAKRVDEMIESGMVDELANYFNSGEFEATPDGIGLNKAIGVPEFQRYFRNVESDEKQRRSLCYDAAVREIKVNTCRLAKRQVEKIQLLRKLGWEIVRVDATEAFEKALFDNDNGDWRSVWVNKVVEPSAEVVKKFIHHHQPE